MDKPETSLYLQLQEKVHNIMSKHFKEWAFEIDNGGQSVWVKFGNVGFARKILKEGGCSEVIVYSR
jgi:hypothetical protein